MNMIILLLALATFVSTLIGGLITLRFSRLLPYFFAFSAGSLMAVAFFEILPESINLAGHSGITLQTIMLTVVISFFFYSLFERFFPSHEVGPHDTHAHIMGPIGATSLIVHSFIDGAAIGAAFQINMSVGLVVALAVLCHDFTDGMNTVTIMLKNRHKMKSAAVFLLLDALAPIFGVLSTTLFVFSEPALAIVLAAFVGEFVYIGAASLLPETYHHPSKDIVLAMAAGIALIAVLVRIA
jgi:zinc transporter ZupT